jgi:ABC-type transporter Mla subunit MlaD
MHEHQIMIHDIEKRFETIAKVLQLSIVIIFLSLLTLSGCGPKELHFKIRFDRIMGLKAGDSLVFEGNSVGRVEAVHYTKGGDYLVDVRIKPNFSNAATHDSRFFISDDPSAEGKKAIEIIKKTAGGELLRNGETVSGSAKPSIFQTVFDGLQKEARRYQGQVNDYFEKFNESLQQSTQELAGELESTLNSLAEQFKQFSEEGQNAPNSQELKKLKESLARLAEEVSRSQQAIREKFKKEVIPKIQERLDRLRKSLDRYNRRKEMAPLDRELNELRKV